jgi:hypothetical protein
MQENTLRQEMERSTLTHWFFTSGDSKSAITRSHALLMLSEHLFWHDRFGSVKQCDDQAEIVLAQMESAPLGSRARQKVVIPGLPKTGLMNGILVISNLGTDPLLVGKDTP